MKKLSPSEQKRRDSYNRYRLSPKGREAQLRATRKYHARLKAERAAAPEPKESWA